VAVESVLIDGEAVELRPDGHSYFAALRHKGGFSAGLPRRARSPEPQRRGLPSAADRGAASRAAPFVADVHCILFSDSMVVEGALVFAKACELGLGGSSRSAPAADIRAETTGNG
jgi:hypothetical protein